MTDYNDGNLHGWNGGECPVHPKSRIEGLEWDLKARWTALAEDNDWSSFKGAFRIIHVHREPRVLWVNEFPDESFGELHTTREDADIDGNGNCGPHRIACHRVVIE